MLPENLRKHRNLGPETHQNSNVGWREGAGQRIAAVGRVEQGMGRGADEAGDLSGYPARFRAFPGRLEKVQAGPEGPCRLQETGGRVREHGRACYGENLLARAEALVQGQDGEGGPHGLKDAAYVARGAAEPVNGLIGIADTEKPRAVRRQHGLQDIHLQGGEVLYFVHEHVLWPERSRSAGRMGCQPFQHVREVAVPDPRERPSLAVPFQNAAEESGPRILCPFPEVVDAPYGLPRLSCGNIRLQGPGGPHQERVLLRSGEKPDTGIAFLNEPPGQGVKGGAGRHLHAVRKRRPESLTDLARGFRTEGEDSDIICRHTLPQKPSDAFREEPGFS